jgi:hypothetical protein
MNQAPVYDGTTDPLRFAATGILSEYAISDFFSDPDDDDFTYVATSGNTSFATIFISNDKFLVKPLAAGETTINFTVTDSHGASTLHSVPVVVDAITGIEDHDVNFHISTYPNPTKGKMSIHIDGEINSSFNVKVFNIFGVPVMEATNREYEQEDSELDLSVLPKGIYLIEITDQKGKSMRRIVKE